MAEPYDVAVIGGGVVGCGVLRACALAGRRCVLIEREAALASSHASGGNTGIACTAADCEPGTVEHACLKRAAELNRDAYDAHNVPHAATGAVYVAYGAAEHAALDKLQAAHGAAADALGSGAAVEARCRLPGLAARGATRGVHVRHEVTVEPWCVPVAWALHARANGAELRLGQEVVGAALDDVWTLELRQRRGARAGAASALRARVLVNCGGLWADDVDSTLRGRRPPKFEVAPRRGDFVVLGASDLSIACPVGGVPLGEWGRGAYAWRTVHGDVIVGPTAEPYAGRTVPADDRSATAEAALLRTARRALGVVSFAGICGRYVGLRPGTKDQSDYVIRRDGAFVTVAGIRSTGLTASLAIGERALALVEEVLPLCASVDPRGFALPSLSELRASYEGDERAGSVRIGDERVSVTHPQTRFGLCRAQSADAPRVPRRVDGAEAALAVVRELLNHGKSVKRVVGGRTSDMFRVSDEDVSVLVRVYGGGEDLGIDRDLEGATFEAAGLHLGRPRCLGHFANGRVEEFLEGHRNTTYEDVSDPAVYPQVAKAVATLHAFIPPPELCGPSGHDLDAPGLWPTLRGWLAAAATDATVAAVARDAEDAKLWSECACFRDFAAFGAVVDAAEARLSQADLDASLVFAHNDLTLDNVMVGADGTVRLIDLERAPASLRHPISHS
jgi:glycerol-3-phosphate dehydrogenase